MSIRAVALDLYRAQKEVGRLEAALASAKPADEETIRQQLCQARAEWRQLRNMLDGAKEHATTPARKF